MIFSLQKRFVLFLLLPVTLILVVIGVASFLYAREYLLNEWVASAQLRLGKAAHDIEMRLDEKRNFVDLIADAANRSGGALTQDFLVEKLSRQEGVHLVEVWPGLSGEDKSLTGRYAGTPNIGQNKPDEAEERISPRRDPLEHCVAPEGRADRGGSDTPLKLTVSTEASQRVLTLEKSFSGEEGAPGGAVIVKVDFDSFMKHILEIGQWTGSYACLVKRNGTYLAHTDHSMKGAERLGETGDALEKRIVAEMQTKDFGTLFGKGHPPDWIGGFHRVPTTDWYLVLFSRGDVVLAPLVHFRLTYLIAGVVSLICIGLLIRWNTRPVARSIREIAEAADEVETGNYDATVPEDRSDEIGHLKRRFNQMIRGLKDRDLIESTFGRYVGKEIADELMKRPEALRLGGHKHEVTILMGDLRGFTQMAEKIRSEDVIKLLNRHFARMISVIERYNGIIVDFYGDSVLAFFDGIETDIARRASDAVKCALEMQQEMAIVSTKNQKDGLPVLHMGIGIHTGEVVVGNIGSESRAKYGIVGSAVNETDRIQSFAEGGTVVISEQTYELLEGRIRVGPKQEVNLKGLDGSRTLYELQGIDR